MNAIKKQRLMLMRGEYRVITQCYFQMSICIYYPIHIYPLSSLLSKGSMDSIWQLKFWWTKQWTFIIKIFKYILSKNFWDLENDFVLSWFVFFLWWCCERIIEKISSHVTMIQVYKWKKKKIYLTNIKH